MKVARETKEEIAGGEASCPACGGEGELAYFRGKSRFLLSRKACPECDGLGWIAAASPRNQEDEQ